MASTSEWLHFHQYNNITATATATTNNNIPSIVGQVAQPYTTTSPPDLFFSGLLSESTVVSTQTTDPIQPSPTQLGPAGRVTKPIRRRTRASRRTPTTLLNTDTANFRAMVQQFTGGPNNSSPQVSNLGPHGFNIGPGLGYGLQFTTGQLQYAANNATMSSSSHNNVNENMLMRRDTIDKNIICDGYFNGGSNINNNNNNNNHVNGGGSSSSENRGSNNNSFQF